MHISEYLDYHLNPLVSLTRSYVKDANHFLARLDKLGKIPEGALICNVSVVRRYPSIPHGEANFGSDEGIKPKQEKTSLPG